MTDIKRLRELHADWAAYECMRWGGGHGAKSDDGEAAREFGAWLVDDFPWLLDEIETLTRRAEEAERERDAAIRELGGNISTRIQTCGRHDECVRDAIADGYHAIGCGTSRCPGWQWRGPEAT